MSEATDILRRANTYEYKGHTGLVFTWRLPDAEQILLTTGEVPLPLVRRMVRAEAEKRQGEGEALELTAEETLTIGAANRAYRRALVAEAVLEIDGLLVHLDDDALDLMHPDDMRDLAARAEREVDPDGGRDDGGP